MSYPPLEIPHYPTIGPTGERDNVERLVKMLRAFMDPRLHLLIYVAHQDGCPHRDEEETVFPGEGSCDCTDVALRLEAAQPIPREAH